MNDQGPFKKKLDDMTEPELRLLLKTVADAITLILPPQTGFVLLAAPFTGTDGDGISQYVANVQRSDASKWMEETLCRWKENDFVPRDGN